MWLFPLSDLRQLNCNCPVPVNGVPLQLTGLSSWWTKDILWMINNENWVQEFVYSPNTYTHTRFSRTFGSLELDFRSAFGMLASKDGEEEELVLKISPSFGEHVWSRNFFLHLVWTMSTKGNKGFPFVHIHCHIRQDLVSLKQNAQKKWLSSSSTCQKTRDRISQVWDRFPLKKFGRGKTIFSQVKR